jgi:hypothetical protein
LPAAFACLPKPERFLAEDPMTDRYNKTEGERMGEVKTLTNGTTGGPVFVDVQDGTPMKRVDFLERHPSAR